MNISLELLALHKSRKSIDLSEREILEEIISESKLSDDFKAALRAVILDD